MSSEAIYEHRHTFGVSNSLEYPKVTGYFIGYIGSPDGKKEYLKCIACSNRTVIPQHIANRYCPTCEVTYKDKDLKQQK